MASEIRVNKIENRSGLGTVTFADTGVDLAGIVTATTFSGSGASLTALPSAQLSGALPAISAASLTNVPAANVVGVHTSLTVTNATTTGTAVVGGGVTISESGIEASGIGITCANINGTQIGGRRNLVINGAMMVAQRGTSTTGLQNTGGVYTIDRFAHRRGGTWTNAVWKDEQVNSGTGLFKKALKKTTTTAEGSAASTGQYVMIGHYLEAQDSIAAFGDGTAEAKSFTVSFYVKASIATTYCLHISAFHLSTNKAYMKQFTVNNPNVWERKTCTIPAITNSIGTVNGSDNDTGLRFHWVLDAPTGSQAADTWYTHTAFDFPSGLSPSGYANTLNATFELGGVQIEAGSQATPFEHRSFGEELSLCQRYFHKSGDIGTGNEWFPGVATHANHGACPAPCLDGDQDRSYHQSAFPVLMRANPTLTFYPARTGLSNTAGNVSKYNGDVMVALNTQPSSSPSRFTGYFQTATTHPAFTFQYTADAEL